MLGFVCDSELRFKKANGQETPCELQQGLYVLKAQIYDHIDHIAHGPFFCMIVQIRPVSLICVSSKHHDTSKNRAKPRAVA